jgi:hypothetical protein
MSQGYPSQINQCWADMREKNNPLEQEFRPNITQDISFVISRIENRYENLRPKQDIYINPPRSGYQA